MRIYARPSLIVVYSLPLWEMCWSAAGVAVMSRRAVDDIGKAEVENLGCAVIVGGLRAAYRCTIDRSVWCMGFIRRGQWRKTSTHKAVEIFLEAGPHDFSACRENKRRVWGLDPFSRVRCVRCAIRDTIQFQLDPSAPFVNWRRNLKTTSFNL